MALPREYFMTHDVTNPRGIVRVIRGHWWWCVDGDPRKAIFYVGRPRSRHRIGSPQCNSNRAISERIRPSIDAAMLCQVALAFVPVED